MLAATGLASGDEATPELAASAVRAALDRAGTSIARSVLLFLTPEFASHAHTAQAAVTAAAHAGHCLQVFGCTLPGVFTERDQAFGRPAAAAMVLTDTITLVSAEAGASANVPCLSLAIPSSASRSWLETGPQRYGALSTDAVAQRDGYLWNRGKLVAKGTCEAFLQGADACIGVSRGTRILAAPLAITRSDGYKILSLAGQPALDTLLRELPPDLREQLPLPHKIIYAGLFSATGDAATALAEGRYTLAPLLATSLEERSVTLAMRPPPGSSLFWALRQPLAAEDDMRQMLERVAPAIPNADSPTASPAFGLMFSCLGRSPCFHGIDDEENDHESCRDLALVRERFPSMPLIGACSAGQIAPLSDGNRLIHNSVVLALFQEFHF